MIKLVGAADSMLTLDELLYLLELFPVDVFLPELIEWSEWSLMLSEDEFSLENLDL